MSEVVAACGLWVLFVSSSINLHEMYVGAACVVLTVVFGSSVARSLGLNLTLRWRDMAQALRIPWYELTGNWTLTLVLIKDLLHIAPAENRFRVCGFDSSRHDPVRIARTVMAVAFSSSAPNFIVIGIDPGQSRMLFHQIQSTPLTRMAQELGAKR
ncbi:MAG: hypothetical protein ACLGSD_10135 [Acidobacteriota bacterium]